MGGEKRIKRWSQREKKVITKMQWTLNTLFQALYTHTCIDTHTHTYIQT